MKYYKNIQKIDSKLVSVSCDKCKKRIEVNGEEWWEIAHSGGYYSSYPGDLKNAFCDLCEDCAKEIFSSFIRIVDAEERY
jgi:hypothetical protein